MLNKIRNRQKGFTLIELLIVVAIIGIIAALLIPNFLDALNKARQKRTMGDMTNFGKAAFSWLTDELGAAAAGAATTVDLGSWTGNSDIDSIRSELIPQYVQEVPEIDGWKNSFYYELDIDNPAAENFALVTSPGRTDSPTTGPNSGTYTVGGFDPTDYDQDIVWGNGTFLRRPQKQQ